MKFREFLTEAKFKVPESEALGVKGLEPKDLARAETIGGMTNVMTEFTKQKVAPMPGNRWKLGIKGGQLHVVWPPKGKLMLRVRMENNPDYYKNVVSVFKAAYKDYIKKLKTVKNENLNEEKKDWIYTVNDKYQTLAINKNKLKDLFNDFVYSLPKKYSTKKKILADIRKDGIKVSPKEFNSYVDGLDESRLEELVGFIHDSIDKWDGV